MIDRKKKQNGMKACFDRRIDDKVEREFMRDPLIAYTRAFEDAIDWFKKALWHSQDEIPEADRLILVKDWKCKGEYITFDTTEELNLEGFDKEHQWEVFCKFADFDVTWCYIDDLLPEGGRQ